MIGYTCKYTPVGCWPPWAASRPFNREANAFSHAEALTHNHFCCHAKAVLEECRRDGVRELVLVNCLRLHPPLLRRAPRPGRAGFSLPAGPSPPRRRLRQGLAPGELERLAAEQGPTGAPPWTSGPPGRLSPLSPAGRPLPGRHRGAGRAGLLEALRAGLPPAGGRSDLRRQPGLPPPPEGLDGLDGLLDWYAGPAGADPCLRMDAVGRREELLNHPGLKGPGVPHRQVLRLLLRVREPAQAHRPAPAQGWRPTSPPLSSRPLHRLEAFLEGLELRPPLLPPPGGGLCGGHRQRLHHHQRGGARPGGERGRLPPSSAPAQRPARARRRPSPPWAASPEDMAAIVATGYGRNNIPFATGQVTEITCHARGPHRLYPEARAIVDIGGQDSKVICLDESGGVTNFVMNDRCAAGTGRFLELMARTLELNLEEMARVGLHWEQELTISSMCTVFAESEVVSLIADNHSAADIVHGLNQSVAAKTAALASRAGSQRPLYDDRRRGPQPGRDGGPGGPPGAPLWLPPEPDLCGALGAALFALDSIRLKAAARNSGPRLVIIRLFPRRASQTKLDELDHQGGQEGQQDDLAQVGKAEGGGHHKEALEPGGEEHQQQKHHTGKEGQDGVLVGG